MTNDSDVALRQPDCVVIDTNIWRSELLLKTTVGVSLIYTLGRQQGVLGLPEIVERELTKHVLKGGLEDAEQAKKYSRIISTLTGSPPFPFVPSQVELEKIIAMRLAELAPVLKRVPFTLAHAIGALDMVDAKVPPNAKENQQFKDSAIWQAVLDLSREYTVRFITNDKGFFFDRDLLKGLAVNLQEDCTAANGSVTIYCDLDSCLEAINSHRPLFDRDRLKSLIEPFVTPRLQAEATRHRYELKELLNADITAFRTADPNRIAMDYTITMRYEFNLSTKNYQEEERRAVAYGSCYYDCISDSISDGFIQEIRFLSRSSHGRSNQARSFEYNDPSIPFPRQVPWDLIVIST